MENTIRNDESCEPSDREREREREEGKERERRKRERESTNRVWERTERGRGERLNSGLYECPTAAQEFR